MKILKGRLIEEKFVDKGTVRTVYQEGEVGYIVSRESHILKNPQMDSVSLHIYAPSGFYDLV